ncbi:MAG: hypothetical protein IPK96_15290 [Flammeovirgaceae bacterium]|nr:hypothetical protein [Flammeovirgaceae bacterium]
MKTRWVKRPRLKNIFEVGALRQLIANKLKAIQQARFGETTFYQPTEKEAEVLETFKKPAVKKKEKERREVALKILWQPFAMARIRRLLPKPET